MRMGSSLVRGATLADVDVVTISVLSLPVAAPVFFTSSVEPISIDTSYSLPQHLDFICL